MRLCTKSPLQRAFITTKEVRTVNGRRNIAYKPSCASDEDKKIVLSTHSESRGYIYDRSHGLAPMRVNGQFYRTGVFDITIGLAMLVARGHNDRYPVVWGIMDNLSRKGLACGGYNV